MKTRVECPYCDGYAFLKISPKKITFKKEDFQVQQHFYRCEKCKEEFTTTDTDSVTTVQAYNQYREKHGLPFPDEIIQIRESYDISAASMSEVLGLGINGYGNYERGEVPTIAIGNLIASAKNPWVFKKFLLKVEENLPQAAFKRALLKTESLITQESAPVPFYYKLDQHNTPSVFTGYKAPSLEKIKSLFIAFIANCNPVLNDRLKLNKLLFYADFLHYKQTGYSISGLSYRPIQFGPVPSYYDNLFALLEAESVIFSDWQLIDSSGPREIFFVRPNIQADSLSDSETEIVNELCSRFTDTSSWDLVELSHQEKAWLDLRKSKELISYQQYAFRIRGVDIN